MTRFLVLCLLVLGVWLAVRPQTKDPAGIPAAATVTLAQLAADPARWDGRQVSVSGTVIDRAAVLGLGGVLIGDRAGNQVLAAGWTGPAVPGRTAQVQGEYRLLLAVGDLQVPVILTDRGG
jgi:hypothetical protein